MSIMTTPPFDRLHDLPFQSISSPFHRPFDRLADVELHLCMQPLSLMSLIRFSRTCHRMLKQSSNPFVGKFIRESSGTRGMERNEHHHPSRYPLLVTSFQPVYFNLSRCMSSLTHELLHHVI